MEPDFSGYATKAGLKCSDGRTITSDAFKHQDKVTLPLVYQHGHSDLGNVLGHAILEHREDGMYAQGFFNETPNGQYAKIAVQHGDITKLSIYAGQLVEKNKVVLHGAIKEVSLVLAGANPGATIDFVSIRHSDGEVETSDEDAIIYTDEVITHGDGTQEKSSEEIEHSEEDPTAQEIFDTLTEEQTNVVVHMLEVALQRGADNSAEHSEENNEEGDLNHQEGSEMTRNVFEKNGSSAGTEVEERRTLTHDEFTAIKKDWEKLGSLKEAILAHAGDFGINNIELLFPDAKAIDSTPELILRRQEWVKVVFGGAKKVPFSRIKSLSADLTFDTARAKGYIKGNMKKEQFFEIAKRETGPQTIYKKQKLDRDDIIDITDFDVVAWLWGEMRLMLEEEIARAILIGDGREIDDDDKIKEDKIRPIAQDVDFYTHRVVVGNTIVGNGLVDAMILARKNYKGAGNPTMFTTEDFISEMLTIRDPQTTRRVYPTIADFASEMRVSQVIPVPVMDGATTSDGDLLAVFVNMSDYTVGADRGGQITTFDDFDIDFNQYKYLIEGRMSGALQKYKTAMVLVRKRSANSGNAITPTQPTFVSSTGVITIPSMTGVTYKRADTGATVTGTVTIPTSGASLEIEAVPTSGYIFPHNFDADWNYKRD